MEIPAEYRGREQAYFKHCLLEAYLQRLFMIVGQHHTEICYVDCFAGPWQSHSDDLEDTSIGVSLSIINKCREGLRKIGREVQFRALFVEKNALSFKNLEVYLNTRSPDGTITTAIQGRFHELRQQILNWCGPESFVFFFIDPTGWKNAVELPTLEPLLRRPNSEFLINFMYDFLSRTVPQSEFQEDVKHIFGLVPHTDGMPPEERENYLLSFYRQNIKQAAPRGKGQPRTACVKVQKPTADRTLYHLVYLTRHPKGIVEFMEASEKLELVQKKIRALAKQDAKVLKTAQFELFSAADHVTDDRADMDLSEVKSYWLRRLPPVATRFGVADLAEMLEDTGWFSIDFQRAFKELANEGAVQNLDAKRARPVNAVNFEKNELLQRIAP